MIPLWRPSWAPSVKMLYTFKQFIVWPLWASQEAIQKYVASLKVVEQHPDEQEREEKEDSDCDFAGINEPTHSQTLHVWHICLLYIGVVSRAMCSYIEHLGFGV